jgi:hypothetical protein
VSARGLSVALDGLYGRKKMKPLFTVHAGEYLVGSHIERSFKRVNVWVPVRDTGVDLLVSDELNRKSISLQVKFSKDFLVTHMGPQFQKEMRGCGWWTIKRSKLANSPADYWIFVLQGFASITTDFVVIPRGELIKRLDAIHGRQKLYQVYLWVTERKTCWETRGLNRADGLQIAYGSFKDASRNLTEWLNNWAPVAYLNGQRLRGSRRRLTTG